MLAGMKALTLRLLCCGLLWIAAGEIRGQGTAGPAPRMISIPPAKPETVAPSVFIDYPRDGQRVGQPVIRTHITATDDTRVESFRFSVNGAQGDWYSAPGMPWPWGAIIQLKPGPNTFGVTCGDYWGNTSSASVTFVYVPGSEVTMNVENGGQVTPNYQGLSLEFGQKYSMSARPAKGFRFDGWSGSVSNSKPKLTFVMEPNLSFTAHFTDVSRPLNIITFPRRGSTVTDATIIATGKAADNSTVTGVYYQLNGGGWETAITTNAWTNWETVALPPVPGLNVIESFAVDDSGLPSRTNRVKFNY
jgi:uncharacterized repeat protein (TIGR02543 family)